MILRFIRFIEELGFIRLVTALIIGAILALVERSLGFVIVRVSVQGCKVGNHLAKEGVSLLVESRTTSELTFNFFRGFHFGIFKVFVPSPDHNDDIIESYE